MLSATVKNWLAENAGSGSCFSQSGISYKDPDGITRIGSTGDVLNAFVVANMIGKSYVTIIAGKTYASLKVMNGNQDIGISDVTWVYENDGSGTAAKYCSGVPPSPTPQPTQNVWGSENNNTSDVFGDDWGAGDRILYPFLSKVPSISDKVKIEFKARITSPGSSLDYDLFGNFISINGKGGYQQSLLSWNNVTIRGETFKWYSLILPSDINGDSIVDWKYGTNTLEIKTWSKTNSKPGKTGVDIIKLNVITEGATPTPSPTPTPPPGVTPTPTPTPGVTPTPPPGDIAGVFEFRGPITGDPTVVLNLSELSMRQHADGHFEMNDIKVTNTSSHPIYIAIRIKLFSGLISACRDTGFVFDGMDRTDGHNIRVKTLEVGETEICDADFFQPISIRGTHSICMMIHGAWTRAELVNEVEHVTG